MKSKRSNLEPKIITSQKISKKMAYSPISKQLTIVRKYGINIRKLQVQINQCSERRRCPEASYLGHHCGVDLLNPILHSTLQSDNYSMLFSTTTMNPTSLCRSQNDERIL
ncbi:hypothetical protein AVEN_167693-1 [Araneus ventricosus]|uniref:Uncharacterized protein n=1 Tax=Araneus ventricosus TaxID=182803 RepID=A0A4Y2NHE2_ARAVE|nr:hypothetical protein AVEN_167693-1 [Araneus ventricosus]